MTALGKVYHRRHRPRSAPPAAAAGSPRAAPPACASGCACPARCRAVIVHPRYRHTLGDAPVAANPPPPAGWASLPLEIEIAIAGHLDKATDLLNLAAACRGTRPLASSNDIWQALCRRRFGVPPEAARDPAAARPGFWRELYKVNHHVFMSIVRSGGGGAVLGSGPRFGQGSPLVISMG